MQVDYGGNSAFCRYWFWQMNPLKIQQFKLTLDLLPLYF